MYRNEAPTANTQYAHWPLWVSRTLAALLAVAVLAACWPGSNTRAQLETLHQQQALWQAHTPPHYRFQLYALTLCGTRLLQVEVKNGEPVAIAEVGGFDATAPVTPLWAAGEPVAAPYTFGCWTRTLADFLANFGTLDRLLAYAEQSMASDAGDGAFEVDYDPQYHFLRRFLTATQGRSEYNSVEVKLFAPVE